MVEITATGQNIEKRMKRNEDSLRDLSDNIKCTDIHIKSPRRRRERERTWENVWRDNSWKRPEHGKGHSQQEAQRVPGRINPRRNTPRHIVIKVTKIKVRDTILK